MKDVSEIFCAIETGTTTSRRTEPVLFLKIVKMEKDKRPGVALKECRRILRGALLQYSDPFFAFG